MQMNDADITRVIEALEHVLSSGGTDNFGQEVILEQYLDLLMQAYPERANGVISVLASRGGAAEQLARAAAAKVPGDKISGAGEELVGAAKVSVDYLIVTIKEEELAAALAAFGAEGAPRQYLVRGLEVHLFESRGIRYGLVLVGVAGNLSTAAMIGSLIPVVSFRGAVLVGMAAGRRDKGIGLGDVIISEAVLDYEFQRLTSKGAMLMPKAYHPIHEGSFRRAETIETVIPGWSASIQSELEAIRFGLADGETIPENFRPTPKLGVILAGGRLFEDLSQLKALASALHDRAKAAEMEGAGLAAACQEWGIPWLIVRGVADFGQKRRPKTYQFAAAYCAAAYVRDALPAHCIVLDPVRL